MKKTTIILSITAAITMFGCKNQNETENEAKYTSKEIRVETIVAKTNEPEEVLNYSGLIVPYQSIPLSFQLPGMVEKIYVDEGDYVRKGKVLAELDKTTMESSYQMAFAMQEQAQDAYDRLKKVYEKGSLPEIQWEEMKSKLQQANSTLIIAKQNLKNTIITAPKSGTIGSRSTEVGSNVVPGISVFDLLNINKVYVRISVSENEIRKIQKGQEAQVVIPAISTESYEARVEKIGVVANLISKTYEVKLVMDNSNLHIKPGMACDINLTTGNAEIAISLPYRAVSQDVDGKSFVYKVEPSSNKAKKQIVQITEFSNNEIKISSGVSIGDLVVVNGQHKLYDNANIRL